MRTRAAMSTEDSHARWRDSTASLGERSAYKSVWDRQAQDPDVAWLAVAGHTDEATLDLTARGTIDVLRATVGLDPNDVILEIGCGIGRVGKPLSRECLHWFGADISGAMLGHAASRLKDSPNTTL
ncbi:MAG TPA: class I SAM-dependent methyltransferase, partial [Opitutaceae bacterium]|nr:class I SAM-dependent methyltransferase [Opitutaceae bacterium]